MFNARSARLIQNLFNAKAKKSFLRISTNLIKGKTSSFPYESQNICLYAQMCILALFNEQIIKRKRFSYPFLVIHKEKKEIFLFTNFIKLDHSAGSKLKMSY